MLIFCDETGQKTAACGGWALEEEAPIAIWLNLQGTPAGLPSNCLYLCPQSSGAVNVREALFLVLADVIEETPVKSQ